MKMHFTIFLVLCSTLVLGQSKWTLIGTYTHSIFMYEYFLTLNADSTYEVIEHTDLGSETTTGTWIVRVQKIVLTPAKRISQKKNSPEKGKTEVPDAHESIVRIEKGNKLTLRTGTKDYQLRRVNKTH